MASISDLVTGVVNAHWLTIELLIERGVLSRDDAAGFFRERLKDLDEWPEVNDTQKFAVRHLARAVSQSGGAPSDPSKPRWTPTVIPGGLDETDS